MGCDISYVHLISIALAAIFVVHFNVHITRVVLVVYVQWVQL